LRIEGLEVCQAHGGLHGEQAMQLGAIW